MYGYVVVNNQNTIVFLDGDRDFKINLQKHVFKQITSRSIDNGSSSSGVCSDSADESSESIVYRRKKSKIMFNSSEVSHILLPLILLYRSTNEGRGDAIESLSSAIGNISITKIYQSHIVLVFANDEHKRKAVLQTVEHTISTSFGPLIGFCNSELTTVRRPKENLSGILKGDFVYRPKPFIDIRQKLFYSDKVSKLKDTFTKISCQLNVFLGPNRCLLLCENDIIATYNSVEGNDDILKGININDLLNIISLSTKSDCAHVSQFWLRSTTGLIPYYCNVITAGLFKNLTFLCLVECSENTLIRYLYLFSQQIDKIRTSEDLNRDLKEIRKTINDIHILLLNRKPVPDSYCVAFMKNPSRASAFFQSIWQQIECEVRQLNNKNKVTQKPRSESRFSISTLRSAFSSMSMNSTVFTRISLNEKTITQKMDILLSYAKRQTDALIQELCSISVTNANNTTLTIFNQCIEKIVRPNHVNFVDSLNIGSVENNELLDYYLKPSEFFLEMYAYRVQFDDIQQEIVFISNESEDDLKMLQQLRSANRFSCDIRRTDGRKFTVFYFHYPRTTSKNQKVQTPQTQSSISICAIFPEFINKNLAEKQTNKLLDCILKQFIQ